MSDLVCSTGPLGKNMWTVDGEFQAVLDLSSFCQGFESPFKTEAGATGNGSSSSPGPVEVTLLWGGRCWAWRMPRLTPVANPHLRLENADIKPALFRPFWRLFPPARQMMSSQETV